MNLALTQFQNPFIRREIRRRMQSTLSWGVLSLYLLGLALIVGFLILVQAPFFTSRSTSIVYMGKFIFAGFFGLQVFIVAMVAPALTLTSISREFERKTFELIRVTPMRTRDLLFGKLGGGLLFLLVLVFAGQPLVSLLGYFSSVGTAEIMITISLLLATTICRGSIGLFYSALVKRTGWAAVLTYLSAGALIIGLPAGMSFRSGILASFTAGGSSSAGAEALTLSSIYFLVTSNPLSAEVGSGLILAESGSLWYYWLELASGTSYLIVSPWIVTTTALFVFSALVLRTCIWILNRKLRQ